MSLRGEEEAMILRVVGVEILALEKKGRSC